MRSRWAPPESGAELEIRVAVRGDLDALVEVFGQRLLFTDRIGRTRQRVGELLVAWAGGVPVGVVYLWCEQLEEPEVRVRFPDVPLLNHLEVVADWRCRGVGTALVEAGEAAALRRGYGRLVIGVAVDNLRARELYERLGYQDWGGGPVVSRWTEPDGVGGVREASLTVDVMVKDLGTAPG